MKIVVAVKRVPDTNIRPRVKADGSGIDLSNVRMSMNAFDENAMEEAIRLKERGIAGEVVAVSIGPAQCQDTLRSALAMGGDRAILVRTETALEPRLIAKLLVRVVADERPDLLLLGKQATDDDAGQVGQMTAALLGWPQATSASKIEVVGAIATVTREVDGGLQIVEVSLPAVVTADLNLNQPRRASLPNVMKAKGKPLLETTPLALGVDPTPMIRVLRTTEPPPRNAAQIVASAEELVARLRAAKAIPTAEGRAS